MTEQEVGKVIHYYNKAMVAVVRLSGNLKTGDAIKIAKGEDEFEMKIASNAGQPRVGRERQGR